MANPCVLDYLFWPLDPVRIWQNLSRAACFESAATSSPSRPIRAIEAGLEGYGDRLYDSGYQFAPGDQPSPAQFVLPPLAADKLVHEENIALFRGIRSRSPLFQALTRTCRVCGQRNCVSMDLCWHCDAPQPDAVDLRILPSLPGYLLAPHDLYLEKCLREKADPAVSVKFGAEVRYYEDTVREELARTNDGAERVRPSGARAARHRKGRGRKGSGRVA